MLCHSYLSHTTNILHRIKFALSIFLVENVHVFKGSLLCACWIMWWTDWPGICENYLLMVIDICQKIIMSTGIPSRNQNSHRSYITSQSISQVYLLTRSMMMSWSISTYTTMSCSIQRQQLVPIFLKWL